MCHKIKQAITSHTANSTNYNNSNDNVDLQEKMRDANHIIDECERKNELFIAHKALHCANQNNGIEEIYKMIQKRV